MKILKYIILGFVTVVLGCILLLTTPILFLIDGGIDILAFAAEPTIFKDLFTEKINS
jgi:hypothetical protein